MPLVAVGAADSVAAAESVGGALREAAGGADAPGVGDTRALGEGERLPSTEGATVRDSAGCPVGAAVPEGAPTVAVKEAAPVALRLAHVADAEDEKVAERVGVGLPVAEARGGCE